MDSKKNYVGRFEIDLYYSEERYDPHAGKGYMYHYLAMYGHICYREHNLQTVYMTGVSWLHGDYRTPNPLPKLVPERYTDKTDYALVVINELREEQLDNTNYLNSLAIELDHPAITSAEDIQKLRKLLRESDEKSLDMFQDWFGDVLNPGER